MKWQNGRQDSKYQICKLFSRWRADAYLIKIPKGVEIPEHTDPVAGKKHFRFNLTLRGKHHMLCERVILTAGRVTLFRPDINKHSAPSSDTDVLLFSFGFVI